MLLMLNRVWHGFGTSWDVYRDATIVDAIKHAVMHLNPPGIDPILSASGRLWHGCGTLRDVYRVTSFHWIPWHAIMDHKWASISPMLCIGLMLAQFWCIMACKQSKLVCYHRFLCSPDGLALYDLWSPTSPLCNTKLTDLNHWFSLCNNIMKFHTFVRDTYVSLYHTVYLAI